MKKIKVLLALALCACALALTAACSKSPDDVALTVVEALRDGKTSVLEDNCTSDAAMGFAFIGALGGEELKGTSFKVTDTDIDGDKAHVEISAKKDGETDTMTLVLKKIDGSWKVDDIR